MGKEKGRGGEEDEVRKEEERGKMRRGVRKKMRWERGGRRKMRRGE